MPLVPLLHLATARSGDKGSHVNIGVIARDSAYFDFLEKHLTEEKIALHFNSFAPTKVKRYLLKNLFAFNFILYNILDGGGSLSLRIDSQGKTFAQALLLMHLEVPDDFPFNHTAPS